MRSTAAATYDDKPWQQAIAEQITKEIRSRLDWIGLQGTDKEGSEVVEKKLHGLDGTQVRMLDYACGPGMASRVSSPSRNSLTILL